jgi:hypothetical protein
MTGLGGREVALMKRRLLVSAAALIMTVMVDISAVAPAWGQHDEGGCDGYEGDHGRGCLPAINNECEDGGWQLFDVLKNLFENQGRCL